MEQQPKNSPQTEPNESYDDIAARELSTLTEQTAEALEQIADKHQINKKWLFSRFATILAIWFMTEHMSDDMVDAILEGLTTDTDETRAQVLRMTKEWLEKPDDAK